MISIKFYLPRNSINPLSEGSLSPMTFLKHAGQQRYTESCCTGNETQERVTSTARASPQGISAFTKKTGCTRLTTCAETSYFYLRAGGHYC